MSVPRALAIAAAILSATACARLSGTFRSFDYGGPVSAHALRQSLAAGRFDSALKWTSGADEGAPGDALLRDLYAGTVAYYAGQYQESAAAMQRAEDLAESRYTRSVSRGALSLVTSDRVLAYEPGATERLMLHYYGALAYLRADSLPGAVVEVRRMMHLVEQYEEAGTRVHAPTRAALHYFAATVFEAAGERNDAAVAYRDAAAAAGDSTLLPPRAQAAPARRSRRAPPPPSAPAAGEVVVLVERGFVAEKAERSLAVSLESDEVKIFASDETDGDRKSARAMALASQLLDQLGVADADSEPYWDDDYDRRRRHHHDDDDDGVIRIGGREGGDRQVLTLAWAALRRPAPAAGPLRVLVDSAAPAAPVRLTTELSDGVAIDYQRIAGRVLARAVARGAAKYYLTKQAKQKGGKVAGALANAGASLLERADTRSWHLLPAGLTVVRLSLPPGVHALAIESGGERVALGDVQVVAGRIAFATGRVWR